MIFRDLQLAASSTPTRAVGTGMVGAIPVRVIIDTAGGGEIVRLLLQSEQPVGPHVIVLGQGFPATQTAPNTTAVGLPRAVAEQLIAGAAAVTPEPPAEQVPMAAAAPEPEPQAEPEPEPDSILVMAQALADSRSKSIKLMDASKAAIERADRLEEEAKAARAEAEKLAADAHAEYTRTRGSVSDLLTALKADDDFPEVTG